MLKYCFIAAVFAVDVPTGLGDIRLSYGDFTVTSFPKAVFQDAVDQD